jgi:hypothetical protein
MNINISSIILPSDINQLSKGYLGHYIFELKSSCREFSHKNLIIGVFSRDLIED